MRAAAGDAAQRAAGRGLSASAVHLCIRALPLQTGSQPAGAVPGEWIEWAGGECPIADGVRHQVLFRDGDVSQICNEGASWSWLHDAEDCDIVAYRVLP